MNDRTGPPEHERDDVATLLQAAGKRTPVPEQITRRVKAAARERWLVETGRARPRRAFGWQVALAAAAALVLLVVAGRILVPGDDGAPASSFVVESLSGELRLLEGEGEGHGAIASLEPGKPLPRGSVVTTGTDGRIALRAAAGHSVRLDRLSRVALPEDGPLRLERGAIYIDSGGDELAPAGLLVQVPQGLIEEIGTQYEIRLIEETLRIRLREGAVRLHARDGSHEVQAGSEISVLPDGSVRTAPIEIHGATWDWVLDAMPTPDLEGQSAAEFLRGYARERGWKLAYDRTETAQAASAAVLSSLPARLPADRLLDAVLPTCRLAYRVEDGVLVVSMER